MEIAITVKTTLSFTDRRLRFIAKQVENGVYATASAGVAAAIEQMIQDADARRFMPSALVDEMRARAATPHQEFVDAEETFAALFAELEAE